MALVVGEIRGLITGDKSDFSRTVTQAGQEHERFVRTTSRDKTKIDADTRPFERAADRTIRTAGIMRARVGSFIGEMRGELLAVGAAAGVIEGMRAIVMAASDLNESANAINVTFAGAQDSVFEFTKTAADSIGQADVEARQAAATFGVYGKQAGLSAQANAEFSISLTKLASDLASFRNTSPQEAVEALGAALRGESDPIEAYGVLLTESVIAQRALKMGVIETTSQALTPQQRVMVAYQEILAQTTDAQGDFQRTSGEFANQLRTLRARIIDKAAALGQSLLPAAKNVVGFLNSAVGPAFDILGNILEGVFGVVGNLASAWGALPGPMQAAIIAALAWRVAQDRITEGAGGIMDRFRALDGALQQHGTVLGALRNRFSVIDDMASAYERVAGSAVAAADRQAELRTGTQFLAQQMTLGQRATNLAVGSLQRLGAVAAGAGAAVGTGLRAAAGSLVGFLGGPWGIALAAGAVALSIFTSRQQAAKQAAEQHSARVKQLTQEIITNEGVVTAHTKAQIVQEAQARGVYKAALQIGVGHETMTKALLGNREAIDIVNRAWAQGGDVITDVQGGLNRAIDDFNLVGGGFENTSSLAKRAFDELSGGMMQAQTDADAASSKLEAVGISSEQLAGKAEGAATEVGPLATAISVMGDESATGAEKVSALHQALDEIAGESKTVEEANQAVNDSLRNMQGAVEEAIGAANRHGEALVSSSGAINTVTEEGSALQDKLMQLSSDYNGLFAATVEAAKASGKDLPQALVAAANAAGPVRERFIAAATAAGLNATEAKKLADNYGLVPDSVATMITQPGMMVGILNALGLGKNIREIPNSWQTVLSSTAPAQIRLMEQLGFKVTHLPDGRVLVTADTAAAWTEINRITSPKTLRINLMATGLSGEALNKAMKQFAGGGYMPANPRPQPRAAGGGLLARMPYLVGEVGAELIWPDLAGYVSTARQTAELARLLDRIDQTRLPAFAGAPLGNGMAGVRAGGDGAEMPGRSGHTFNISGPDARVVAREVLDMIRAEEALYDP